MFGKMNLMPIMNLHDTFDSAGCSTEVAIVSLLKATDHPRIAKWIQLPKALLVFLIVPGDPESGAFYVYDRRLRIWLWLDFEDEKFGGYSVKDFDTLVRECKFLDVVENPRVLLGEERLVIQSGAGPRPVASASDESSGAYAA